MRLGNPAVRRYARKAERGELEVFEKRATYGGVYLKAALYAALTIIAAVLIPHRHVRNHPAGSSSPSYFF